MNLTAKGIAQEIERHGPITLARFMELALYAPETGYYEQKQEIGRKGDFYTSVCVGSVFGELLAFQFVEWMKQSPRFSLVESGAHAGQLAGDILKWIQQYRPEAFE